ncbi:MAG: hypothetical protein JO079_03220 [Frankiaceae bacterium]|nr:hypothetical protein [Frankiaceae bacterium]
MVCAACSAAKPHATTTPAAGSADTNKSVALAWATAHQRDADIVVSSIHQIVAELDRALSSARPISTAESGRLGALAQRLRTALAPVEVDLIRSDDAASNGENFAVHGVTELRTALSDIAGFADRPTTQALRRLHDATLVAISDWDAGARIVWSMAGLTPPLP